MEYSRRKPIVGDPRLGLESLETRLNLSALHAAVAPAIAKHVTATRIISTSRPKAAASPKIAPGGAAAPATILGGSTTGLPVASYSAIYNSQLETINGQSDIGYVSTNGAWVEYTVSAPTAGAYILNVNLAGPSRFMTQVSVDGSAGPVVSAMGTGGWQTYATSSLPLRLNAGTNVIRFSSLNGTQYNVGSMSLTPAASALAVGDGTVVPVTAYSAITGSKLEYFGANADIGYVSKSGATQDYNINVGTAGTYTVTIDAASISNGQTFDLLSNGTKLASYKLSNTWDWQTYGSFTQTVTLPAGVQTLEIASTAGSQYNLRSMKFTLKSATPVTTPATTPTTTPVTTPTTPATTPTTAPATPATPAVSVAQRWMSSFTELDITETVSNAAVTVSQSGSTIRINANGQMQTVTGSFGDIVIYAGSGNASVIVDSSVTTSARIYAGSGTDVLKNFTTGQATIVTLDGGSANVTGNGINTAYWVTPSDTVNASRAETAAGDVHTISNFYQPYTSNPAAAGYVTNTRDGANLTDPTSAGHGWTRLTSSSLWGTGPLQQDVNQGQAYDCYFLSTLSSLAQVQPAKLQQMAVDLGDGTFAVQFQRGGKTTYVRVDADLPTAAWGGLQYAHTGVSGNEWALIMEKAYAYYRSSGANSYSSLDWGFNSTVYTDLGVPSTTLTLPASQSSFYATASAKLAANKGVDVLTNPTITAGAPLVGSHCYSVTAVSQDSAGTVWVTVRNPWGYDGAGNDSNPNDALVTMQYSTLLANATFACMMA